MQRVALLLLAGWAVCWGQGRGLERADLRGELVWPAGDTQGLAVELEGASKSLMKVYVTLNGQFEIRDLVAGTYRMRISDGQGSLIQEELVEVKTGQQPLQIHIRQQKAPRAAAGRIHWKQYVSPPPKKAVKAFEQALHFSEAKDYKKSEDRLREAIRLHPEFSEAHANLGVLCVRMGRMQEALEETLKAMETGSASALLYTNAATAQMNLGRAEEAEKSARKALQLDPSYSRAHFVLGILTGKRNRQEALEHFAAAAHEVPTAYLLSAEIRSSQGDDSGVEQDLRAYLQTGAREHEPAARKWLARFSGR